jgi:hypothetical protein
MVCPLLLFVIIFINIWSKLSVYIWHHLITGTISMQVNGLMKLMNGENTGPINIGNPGKTPSHLCHSLAALDNLISDLFVILYLHFCGNELEFFTKCR